MGLSNIKSAKKLLCNSGYTKEIDSVDSPNGKDLQAYTTDLMGKDLYKNFNEFNMEQQGRIIELYFDATFLKYSESSRKHHQMSIKLESYVLYTLRNFLKNPKDKSLLPLV